jgi:hypothetical protein
MLYYVAEGLHFTTNWDELSKYWDNSVVTLLLLLAMLTTIVLFLISFIQLVIALFLYPFVLSYIKGNLKEYVCHKVDKRMGEVMRRMQKRRFNEAIELEKKVAAGETIMNSRGEVVDASLLQPTLPKIDLSDHPGPSRPSDRLLGRPMSPAMGGPMSPAMGRPMSPAVGRPMSPAMGGPNSAAALRSASPAPTPDVYVSNWTPQPPASISHETTEMEIYDAYSDSPSDDDHSSYYHGVTSGTGSALGHSSNLGHGSNHGHGYGHSSHHGHGHHPFPRQRDYDSTQVGLLSGAAPMGHSAPMRMYPTTPAPAGAPGYPPPNPLTAGAPSFPPSHSSPAPSVASLAPSLAPPSRVLVPSSGRAGTAPNAPLQRSGLQYNVNAHGW